MTAESGNEARELLPKTQDIHLEAVLDNFPDAVIVIDQEGRLIYSNQATEALLGTMPANIDPEHWPEILGFFLDDGVTHYPGKKMPLLRALTGESVRAEEMILQPPGEGDRHWIAMSAQPLAGENGQISGAIVVIRDITYRKQIELSRENYARRVEALYALSRSIAESGNDLSQIVNTVAAHAAQHLGDGCILTLLNPENGLKIAAVHHSDPNARAILKEIMVTQEYELEKGIVGGVVQAGEPLLIPSAGPGQLEAIALPEFSRYVKEIGIHSVLVVPIKSRSGALGAIGLFRDREGFAYTADNQSLLSDIAHRAALAIEHCILIESLQKEIAERKTVQKALDDSEVRFRSIFESAALGVKIFDLEGNILQINPAFREISRYSEYEIIGAHLSKLLHPADSARTLHLFENLKKNLFSNFRLEHRILDKNGSVVWVNTIYTGVKTDVGEDRPSFIFGIVENITERKHIEAEMVELKGRLHGNIEKERLRLAQELHDGPMQDLYSAIYQIEGLRDSVDGPHQEMLVGIKNDLQKVLHELRATAKELRPPTIANFGLEKAIRSHAEEFNEKYPDINLRLSLAVDHQLLPVDVRLVLFRIYQQALANVIRHAAADEVHVRFVFDAEEATLEITDNGSGFTVPANWLDLTRRGHFGLAGAAERAQVLGGSFTVESGPGSGTTVRVTLPLQESPE